MGSRKVTMPRRMRIAHASAPWTPRDFRVVHSGQSAIVLNADLHGDVVLSGPDRGLVPGGICLPDPADFERAHGEIAAAAGPVDLTHWALADPTCIEWVNLAPTPIRPDPAALLAWNTALAADPTVPDAVMDPRPLRALAAPFAAAALTAQEDLTELARRLVGAGPGATPTGDDTIVGVLAALAAVRGTALDAGTVTGAQTRIASAVTPLLSRTTRASRHDLSFAMHGLFAERLHPTLHATTRADLVPEALAAARSWGATSGIDLAQGIVACLDAVLTSTPLSDPADPPAPPDLRRSA